MRLLGGEVRTQGFGDHGRQRHFRFDGVVLDLPYQPDRQIYVELLYTFFTHVTNILAI